MSAYVISIDDCEKDHELCSQREWFKSTDVIIPVGTTKIGNHVFQGCAELVSVEIPDSVISIGKGAFNGCSKLKHVRIPSHVEFLGEYVFRNCYMLDEIILPEKISTIGRCSFDGCSKLISVIIPKNITDITNFAFANCEDLRTIHIPPTTKFIDRKAFVGSKHVVIEISKSNKHLIKGYRFRIYDENSGELDASLREYMIDNFDEFKAFKLCVVDGKRFNKTLLSGVPEMVVRKKVNLMLEVLKTLDTVYDMITELNEPYVEENETLTESAEITTEEEL